MDRDQLFRARARLVGIRHTLEGQPLAVVPEACVHEFHEALGHLEAVGIDVEEFKIPRSRMRPNGTGNSARKERVVAAFLFLARLGACLAYMEFAASSLEGLRRPPGFTAAPGEVNANSTR